MKFYCSKQIQQLSFSDCQKTFQCAHCNADANQRIKGIQQLDKEGLMPTSVPLATIIGIKHIVCFSSPTLLALDKQNGGSCRNGTQHKSCSDRSRYYQMILWTQMQLQSNNKKQHTEKNPIRFLSSKIKWSGHLNLRFNSIQQILKRKTIFKLFIQCFVA